MRFKWPLHGRTHSPGGSDPIDGFIAFDKRNGFGETHYLWISASGTAPSSSVGIVIAGNGMEFNAQGQNVTLVNTDVYTANVSGGFNVISGGPVTITATGSTPDHGITLDGATVVDLSTVGNFVGVNNHLGAEIFRIDEDGSVHIKTGTAVIADLP